MDWLDRISIWAIVLLIIGSVALIAGHVGEARPDRYHQQPAAGAAAPPAEIENSVRLARKLLEGDNPAKAETLMADMVNKYPYEAAPRMVMGDIFMRKQDPVRAMREYKEAVELNPDYLDRKTPLFQGKKLRIAVGEALTEIEKRIRSNPADDSLKKERKVIYYLQRKIAGSCS